MTDEFEPKGVNFSLHAPDETGLSEKRSQDRRQKVHPINFEDRRFLDRRRFEIAINRQYIVPRFADNYSGKSVRDRRHWTENRLRQDLSMFDCLSYDSRGTARNIENIIGATQIPLAVAGPLLVNGKYAKGVFYVPMATTQGTLVEAYHRGAMLCSMAGGINSVAYKDGVHITPSFVFRDMHDSLKFVSWVRENQDLLRTTVEKTSRYARLIRATPFLMGRITLLNLLFTTGDASGLNMINIAADAICRVVMEKVKPQRYFLRSNFSSDKKVSFFNLYAGYGKEVLCEVTLPKKIISRLMRTTAEDMFAFWYQAFIAGTQAGMVGPNAHFANALSAIYLATGQDVAQIVNASSGLLTLEVLPGGDLRVYCKFPQLIVATVGGGTSLPFQRACLEMMGCYGEGKVMKFAEIVAATALAGEVSICGAIASGEFAAADVALRKRIK